MRLKIFAFIMLVLSASNTYADRLVIPSGNLPWSTLRDTYLNVMTDELYTYMGATGGVLPDIPTLPGLIISGAGDSWLELSNNASFSDSLTGKYGLRFYNGVLQQIINGNVSSIGGGTLEVTEASTLPDPSAMTSGDIVVATDSGDMLVKTATGSYLLAGVYTANAATYSLTLAVSGAGTVTVGGTGYTSSGSPHTISSLSGATSLTGAYGGSNNTLTWSGTDSADVSGSYPNYSITMDEAKSLTATFSETVAEATPDVLYACEDNAASTTVTATYGPNGTLIDQNTSANTSTDNCGGTRSFAPAATTTRLLTGALTEASLDDGAFTIQFDYRADNTTGYGAGNYVRLVAEADSGQPIMFRSNNGSSTAFLLMVGGTEYNVTLDDINTNTCHTIRIVVDAAGTNKVVVYQGASEGALSAKYTRTASITTPNFPTYPTIAFGSNGDTNKGISLRNGKMDDIKIWYTAVNP